MSDELPRPRRDLEFIPISHDGQELVLVRDGLGLVREPFAARPELLGLLSLFEVHRTVDEVAAGLAGRGGAMATPDGVRRLAEELDRLYLLDSERFREARREVVDGFTRLAVRPSCLSGRSYPGDAGELGRALDRIMALRPDGAAVDDFPKALVAPHIDLEAGGRVYAGAYSCLARSAQTRVARVVVLGIGHQLTDGLFSVTDKDFETPLGTARTDREAASLLLRAGREAGGPVLAPDDFAHRSEHSIEFQVLFLQHLLGADNFSLVSVLCGSPGLLEARGEHRGRAAYRRAAGPFLAALREVASAPGTLLVAGVDMSHIGPKFGHDRPAEELEGAAAAHDASLLEALCRGDADAFWEASARERDRYNVCGFAALACLLEVLPGARGRVLDYSMWHEAPTRSAVSFAAAVLSV